MKFGIFLCLIFICIFCNEIKAQDLPSPFEFKIVDTTITATKSELYNRALSWVATNCNSADDIVQMKDEESGKLIVKTTMPVPYGSVSYLVDYTITIDIKNNRYRAVLSNFNQTSHTSGNPGLLPDGGSLDNEKPQKGGAMGMPLGFWKKIRKEAFRHSEKMLLSIAKAMSNTQSSDDGF